MAEAPKRGRGQTAKDASTEKKMPPCEVTFVWKQETIQGTSSHFSDAGILIQCSQPAPLNSRIKLTLNFPFLKNPIETQGEVVWSNMYGPEEPLLPRGIGVKFVGLDAEKSRLLNELAARYKGQENPFACYYT
jgi:hypothetical protein